MNDQVDEVKQKTDIVSLIGSYIEVKKAGSKFKALCPFHSEKTPSFIISPELQIYKCFGCSKSGDAFTFLEEYEGMEFYEALNFLAEKAGIKLKPIKGYEKGVRERLYEINLLVTRFYEFCLHKHPSGKPALNYLTRERGLTVDTIRKFRLGFSPNEPLALRKFIIERNKVSLKDLESTGVVYNSGKGSFDRFRGRVIFPLFDQRGNIAGFAGRILPGASNRDLAKYINTPETLIYKKSQILYGLNETKKEIKKGQVVVVVEGEFDLINSWQVGIKNLVAIKGSALTEEQVKLLSRYSKTIILALDEDFAGSEASIRGIKIAEKEGFEIKVARLKSFKDPADAAIGDPGELKKSILDATDIWDFIINFVFNKYKSDGGNTKAKISKEVTPVLASIEDKIVQAHYISLVAQKLKVPVEAVQNELSERSLISTRKTTPLIASVKGEAKTRREILEENLLTVVLKLNPKLLENKRISDLLVTPLSKKITLEYLKQAKGKKFDISRFKDELPAEVKGGFVDMWLKEIEGIEDDDEGKLREELKLIVKNLEEHDLKAKRTKLGEKIKYLEEAGKKNELKNAQNKYTELNKKLSELEASDFKGIII